MKAQEQTTILLCPCFIILLIFTSIAHLYQAPKVIHHINLLAQLAKILLSSDLKGRSFLATLAKHKANVLLFNQ